ncbi:RING-H2 finger protein ATL43-like [Apium graveolens]|uniref:RING-H2 finger protein ATL43-like n=1 Tax=Apium graveolens TaxID=4045 RepID=UPI003D7AB9BF
MIRLLCILLCLNLTLLFSQAKNDTIASSTTSTSNSNPPLSSPPLPENSNSNPNQNQTKPLLKPSIHIIVGAIISAFSITFLIFLYIKHCKTANNAYPNTSRTSIDPYTHTHRKNSGIDPNIIDLLPVFRFSSLKGQKEGLECAVCLTNYEPSEVLRLLPKCKHAFHVECLDTWLDAHSTCPLCRHRVEPEDVLLLNQSKPTFQSQNQPQLSNLPNFQEQELVEAFHRTSGRHSSAGEKVTTNPHGHLQITVQKQMGCRLSLDSSIKTNRSNSVSLGCFEKPRKDQLLLDTAKPDHRLHHRIVISSSDVRHQRWSDVRPSELLYIKSEMLMSESRRVSAASEGGSGKMVNKERSVSEIISRKRGMSNEVQQQRQRQQEGFVSRWLAWVSDATNQSNNYQSNITVLPPPVLHPSLDP